MKLHIISYAVLFTSVLLGGCQTLSHNKTHTHSHEKNFKNTPHHDITGTWVISAKNEVINDTNISKCTVDADRSTVFFLKQTDDTFTIIEGRDIGIMPVKNGIIENNIYLLSDSFNSLIESTTFTATTETRLYITDMDNLKGSYQWKWTEDGTFCQGSGILSGRKITGLPPHLDTGASRTKGIIHRRIVHSYP